jgi:hypothetical protein
MESFGDASTGNHAKHETSPVPLSDVPSLLLRIIGRTVLILSCAEHAKNANLAANQ